MNGLKLSFRSWLGLIVCVAALFGCSDDSKGLPKARLIDGKETGDDIDLSAEQQRKQEMQLVTLHFPVDQEYQGQFYAAGEQSFEHYVLVNELRTSCDANCPPSSITCEVVPCEARGELCIAHSLLEIIGLTSEPFLVTSTGWQVPAQTAATNAALAAEATMHAMEAVRRTGEPLLWAAYGDPWPNDCGPDQALAFSASFVEGYYLYKQITDVAVEQALAVADAELSSTPSRQTAVARGITAGSLSRAAAAHWLVGGDPGLLGSETAEHWCTQAELSPEARTAVGVFREAAVSPDAITSPVGINELLNGFDFEPGGSVRQRLTQLWDTAGEPVEQMTGLRTSDFVEARAYLSEEIRVFGRTSTAVLPARPLVGGQQTTFPIYAATAREPSAPDPSYFATLARYRSQYYDFDPQLFYLQEPNLAWFVDGAISQATEIVGIGGSWPGVNDPAVRDALRTPLALLVTNGVRERRGRLVLFSAEYSGQVWAQVGGFGSDDGVLLVRGEDGLRCATQGSIEGASCDLQAHTLLAIDSDYTLFGFTKAVQKQVYLDPIQFARFEGRVYLVRSRSGPGGKAGDFESLGGVTVTFPDSLRELSIVPETERRVAELLEPSPRWCARPKKSCAGEEFDARLPLEDELTDDNDGVESSWKHYLTLAEQAATEADQLGQEVLQRGLEMDMRGEQAIGELQDLCGSSVDSTVLLNALSGGGAGLTQLTTDVGCTQDSDCSFPPLGSAGRCVANLCMRDPIATVGSTQEDADFNRLKECLGDDTVLDFVTPGIQKLCLWHEPGDKNRICTYPSADCNEGAHQCIAPAVGTCNVDADCEPKCNKSTHQCTPGGTSCASNDDCSRPPCPLLAKGDGCGGMKLPALNWALPASQHYTPELVQTTLGYFDNSTEEPDSGRLDDVCNAIRQARVQPSAEAVKTITASNYFHPDNLKQVGLSIGWEARFGGFSAITVDGRPKFSTGDAWGGVGSEWPCNSPRASNCGPQPDGTNGNGLFCYVADNSLASGTGCDRPENLPWLVNINERMALAVFAIRATTQERMPSGWDGLSFPALRGIRVPFWLQDPKWSNTTTRNTVGNLPTTPGSDPPTPIKVASEDFDTWIDLNGRHWRHSSTWKGTVETYKSDSTISAWCQSTGVLQTACTNSFSSSPAFAIGDVDIFINQLEFDPLQFWQGLSNSVTYRSGWPNIFPPRHAGWFRDVLTGTRKPGAGPSDVGSVWPQVIPWLPYTFPADHRESGAWPTSLDRIVSYGVRLPDFQYSGESLLDGMELLCEVGRDVESSVDLLRPFTVSSIDDLEKVKVYLDKLSRELNRRAGTLVFQNFPTRAVDALRNQSSQGSYAAVGGELGVEVAKLRGAVVDLGGVAPLMATEFHLLGLDINDLRLTLERNDVANEIAHTKFLAEMTSQLAACAGSMKFSVDSIWGSAVACANAFAQINFTHTLQDLTDEDTELARQLAINDFNSRFATRVSTLSGLSQRALEDDETIDASLAGIETLRSKARRALSQALFLDSDQAGAQFASNTVMRRHFNLARTRYEEARKNAVRMAFLAKRAIELRLGINLSELREDLPLVPAPATWESTVCESVGVDYEAFRNASQPGPDGPLGGASLGKFADPFIGSYVTKLRNVIESYRLVNNFHEGTDTAVISLRDDVHNVRADCETPVGNLLYHAGQLDHFADAEAETPGWEVANCSEPSWVVGCADGTQEQTFGDGRVVGCAGSVTFANRGSLCAPGSRACSASEWVESRSGAAPTHNYWTNNDLRYTQWTVNTCAVSPESGGTCAGQPMRVCAALTDPEGNSCSPMNCGYVTATPGEYFGGCVVGTAGSKAGTLCCAETSCVQPVRLDADGSQGPFPDPAPDLSEVRGYTVAFGPMRTCTSPGNCTGEPCNSSICGLLQPNSALVQRVTLAAGEYRLSWYGRWNEFASLDPALAVDVRWGEYDLESLRPAMLPAPIPVPGTQWARYYFKFSIQYPTEVKVAIARDPEAPLGPAQVDIAALMLEDVSTDSSSNADLPKAFANTSDTLTRMLRTCEDTNGDNFRRERWRRECVRLCSDGLSANCTQGSAQTYCYRETHFNVNQRDIDAGRILNASSFARGNFNYRIESLGVNFVGSGIRDCSSSDSPTACNGAGFATYSFEHGGPFYVRNHLGRDFRADLFTGKIEHARGLATERYFTNPLSSSDNELINQYMRSELRGRPLDGNFVLRVWEEPGVNFDAIDDVQLILKYRYWTGFD